MAATDTTQLSNQLRGQLKAYLAQIGAVNATLKDVNQIQSELEVEQKPINLVKGRLDKAYDLVGAQTEEELNRIDATLQTLDSLEVLTNALNEAAAGKARGSQNKKRKVDDISRAGSPASSAAASPMPAYSNAGSPPIAASGLPRPSSVKPQPILPSQPPPPLAQQPVPIAPLQANYKKPSIKARKDALLAQLPLKPGRQIAVKESKKGAPPAPGVPDNFILGRVVTSIQGDKNRYSVEDVDYDPNNPTPDGGKWNTTLKSIIPLPQPGDPSTYPDYDYPPGTNVLACYPETTSFYKAVVDSGPFGLQIGAGKKKEVQKLYRLRFEDDDGMLRDVPVELVCETPLS
ncbi:hypothetical protein JCM8097_002333 [Rhodosporidiobolus ruineniae]